MSFSADFQKALDGDPVVEAHDTGSGYFRVNVAWSDGGRAKLDLFDDHADWKHLSHLKLMSACHDAVRAVFPKAGLRYLLCGALDDNARKALDKNGDWYETTLPDGTAGLRWDLNGD